MKQYKIYQGNREFSVIADEISWKIDFFNDGLTLKKEGRVIAYFEKIDAWIEIYGDVEKNKEKNDV